MKLNEVSVDELRLTGMPSTVTIAPVRFVPFNVFPLIVTISPAL
jgi:hypothetical protein